MPSFPEVLVTDRAVFFDGQELPGVISQDGVSFQPGGGDDYNRLTIEFIVSTTTFTDSAKHELWRIGHSERWFWLWRQVGLEFDLEEMTVDRILKEYARG